MKTLIGALFGAGALGLLLVAYLALTGRQEVRQDVSIDKANFEQEATRFDHSFEQKWQAYEGKEPKKGQRNDKGMHVNDAKSQLDQMREQLTSTQAASDEDLAEMKATLEAIGKKR